MRKHVKSLWSRFRLLGAIATVLFFVCAGMLAYLQYGSSEGYPETAYLAEHRLSFKELSVFFTELSYEKGAVYAFEALKRAPIPPNVDVHLLGHVVGDILYKQQGAKGILLCTPDFRNACSHTIVIGTLLEKGPDSFTEISSLCKQAPGGTGAYTMCFHGLGHGVLAYNDYELPAAVKMCEKASATKGREYVECVGGTIMEMIAGVHDPEMRLEKSKKYFREDDPLYPCSAPFMDSKAKGICYTYLTPHLYEHAGADVGHPKPAEFKKAFTYCEPLTGVSRTHCFDGFGKEFTVLAQNRDVRSIGSASDAQLTVVLDWCELAAPRDGKVLCFKGALHSLFWGGENDPGASVRFCALADIRGYGKECFDDLIATIRYYVNDPARRSSICSMVIEPYAAQCKRTLL